MHNRGQMYFGLFIILLGVLFLIGNFFEIDIGALFWPLLLIGIGLWIIFRPQMVGKDTAVTQKVFGGIDRHGSWEVTDEDISFFIGDIELDMSKADIPVGETRLKVSAFIGDIKLIVPEGVGVAVNSNALISTVKAADGKQESFFSPLNYKSEQYKLAERRIRLDANQFISEIKIR